MSDQFISRAQRSFQNEEHSSNPACYRRHTKPSAKLSTLRVRPPVAAPIEHLSRTHGVLRRTLSETASRIRVIQFSVSAEEGNGASPRRTFSPGKDDRTSNSRVSYHSHATDYQIGTDGRTGHESGAGGDGRGHG